MRAGLRMRWRTAGSVVAALGLAAALAACGSGDGSSTPDPVPPTDVSLAVAAAAALPSNDSAVNPAAPFAVLQAAGLPAVTVAGPPKVNFTVFSDGAVKTGLTITDVSFAIAKLVPGTNGNPAEWQNYVSRRATASAPGSPGAAMVPPATAMQASNDPKRSDAELAAAGLGPQLVYNPQGYYTYTFSADIADPDWAATINRVAYATNGAVFDPDATHRIAIQLSYRNAAGELVRVNPHFAIRFVRNTAGGYDSVVLSAPATQDHLMSDVSSCNTCHEKLALHGGGRVDVQYCVMCHNPGTTDPDSGNVLTMSTLTHKIHAGRLLSTSPGGENYTIWGFNNTPFDYADVGFPQDLRNCAKCHTSQNPTTPQGDQWKSVPSQEACLTCHASNTGSSWDTSHLRFATALYGPTAVARSLTNADCLGCHRQGSNLGADTVHWPQNEVNRALYKMNIEAVVFNDTPDHKGRTVTVRYFLSNPTADNAAYDLVTADCGGSVGAPACSSATKFGNLRFYLGYQNMVGQPASVTEFSAFNNGGNTAFAYAYQGLNDGRNHYTVALPVPDDTPTAVAFGTALVASAGQVKEVKLQAMSAAQPRPPVVPAQTVDTVVQHASANVVLSGVLQPRRTVVSNDKCNACHAALGTASGSNTLPNAFHSGARTTVEICAVCHDANRASSTVMTNGLQLNESYQFNRMIHGIHGNAKRYFPFTHGNRVVGAFCNPANTSAEATAACNAALTLAPEVDNFAATALWPGASLNCNACHVDDSYQRSPGTLGAVVLKSGATAAGPVVFGGATVVSDPWAWGVISPMAASCTSCHDSPAAQAHVVAAGNASFGTLAQGRWPQETCADCHAVGLFMGVDRVHGLR